MSSLRILVADDHKLVLEGLLRLFESTPYIVDTVEDGRAVLAAAERLCPDIVILDIAMPFLNGLETARRLRKILPRVKIVFLTMHGDPTYVQEAIRAGASGYLVKDSAASELLIAVREVAMGRAYISSRVAKTVLSLAETGASESAVQLTSRQHEVLQLVAEGHANKEIAALLNISSKTVEFHKSALMKQLGVASTAELTRYAVRHGIADSA